MTPARSADSPARFVRPELRELGAYHLDQTECRYKLDQNEVPWDLPARVKRAVAEQLLASNWAGYPDFHADRLRRALAERYQWPFDGVLAGNGSNELLGLSLEAFAVPGGEVLGALPSFGLYEMFVRRAAAKSRFLPPREDLGLQIDELRAEIARDPSRPVILCSPNNPTGAAATVNEVAAILDELEAPLLLDNAYGEFCRFDYRPLLERHENLVIFRTFSKAWSLGGMRLGYLLAHPQLVEELIKVKLPYNLNHAASLAGVAALENASVAERRVRVLCGRREQFRALLLEMGFDVLPSEGNFLLVRTQPLAEGSGENSGELLRRVREGLAERGILVRDVSAYPGLEGSFRIGVGCGGALRATRSALEEILR